jgi:hypothetical protein
VKAAAKRAGHKQLAVLVALVVLIAAVPAAVALFSPQLSEGGHGSQFHLFNDGSFVSTGGGAGTFTISATSGDTLIVFEWDTQLTPHDSQSNTFGLVIASGVGLLAIWNTTLSATGTDTVTIGSGSPSTFMGWGVTVADGRTLASGDTNPATPSSLAEGAIGLFAASFHNNAGCQTQGGTAWAVTGCLTISPFAEGAFSQNVTSGSSPEFSANATNGGTVDDFVWTEIPDQPGVTPQAPSTLSASSVSESQANLAWANPPGALTDDKVLVFDGNAGCVGAPSSTIDLSAVVEQASVTSLSPGTFYGFEVEAENSTGVGTPSPCAYAETSAGTYYEGTAMNESLTGTQTNLTPLTTVSGGTVVIVIGFNGALYYPSCSVSTPFTVTDSQGNSWTGGDNYGCGDALTASVAYANPSADDASDVITVTASSGDQLGNPFSVVAMSFSGVTGSVYSGTTELQDLGGSTHTLPISLAHAYGDSPDAFATFASLTGGVPYTAFDDSIPTTGNTVPGIVATAGYYSCVPEDRENYNVTTNVSGYFEGFSIETDPGVGTCPPPPAPTGVSVGSITETTATVSWTQSTGGGIVNNTVLLFTGATCSGTPTQISTDGVATTQGLSELTDGTVYSVRVASWNTSGESPFSACVEFSTTAPAVEPHLVVDGITENSFDEVRYNGTWTNVSVVYLVVADTQAQCLADSATYGGWTWSVYRSHTDYIPGAGVVDYYDNLTYGNTSFVNGSAVWVGLYVHTTGSFAGVLSCQEVAFTTSPPPSGPPNVYPLILLGIVAGIIVYAITRRKTQGEWWG